MSLPNPFNTLQSFSANGGAHPFYSLPALESAGFKVSRLPVSIRLVLESLLRNADGKRVTEQAIRDLAGWGAKAPRTEEIPFVVARIVLQDFTGVPLLVDLAAMRSAVVKLGKNPKAIEPLVPVDLVVDHSVQVDFAGSADALAKNLDLEFSRNRERYQFLKWGMQAFDTFKVVPPGIGIVHQVNLEFLAKGVLADASGVCYPDTLVGTDSHTTMINGLGIVGWGVGGIEAEAGMLGQPVYFLTPDVVGVHLTGALREGVTADGKTKLKVPSASMSTAEAISVITHGMSLAAHFGDGVLRGADLAAGMVGAIVKDPLQDRVAMLEYLETVVKEREGWKDLYRACRDVME